MDKQRKGLWSGQGKEPEEGWMKVLNGGWDIKQDNKDDFLQAVFNNEYGYEINGLDLWFWFEE